ncbi:tyrosine-type recombinase/integrase [Geminicoccus roseus]|uniref:tyrosine-type recombinase/integrase n=1 Tax=Geminicoccus roseus TaxID=404900 RepID=UPI00040455E1|nr:site-specific integrase [Geminicoccus roseus]
MPTKLTPAFIKAIEAPASGNRIEWDTVERGLGLRITASGHRSFVLRYVVDGRERRMTLGEYPALSLSVARQMASERKGEVIKGADPLDARKAARDALTVAELIARYLDAPKNRGLSPRTLVERKRYLNITAKPLHRLAAERVGRADVAALFMDIAKENGPIAANRARATLSAMFAWAIAQGLVQANPIQGTAKPGEEKSRDRILSPDELRTIWQACGDDDHGRIVQLLLLTGQRREEIGGMRWSELDLDAGLWSLPAARTKNGRSHDVPLCDAAIKILERVEHRPKRDLVFGTGSGPFSGWSRCKERLDRRIALSRAKAAGRDTSTNEDRLTPWVLHDLRRTLVTGMAELGIVPHVIEAVVNHISGHKSGVAGVYNRATYASEKRAALARWGTHVEVMLLSGLRKIVPLRRAAG